MVYLTLFQPKDLKTLKNASDLFGGGPIVSSPPYIISLRDELAKIKQTLIFAEAVDSATLNTMFTTLAAMGGRLGLYDAVAVPK